jgi:hypothetical protein
MDSEDVNSLSDTVEAQQIASVVEDTYYNIIAAREIPEHSRLLSLVSLSDTNKPTHFKYPTDTKKITRIEYNVGTVANKEFKQIYFVDPLVFLDRMDEANTLVETFEGNVDIFVASDRDPAYYTSFDDEYLIFDSYNSAEETFLQASKTRAWGSVYPTFSQPLLLAEAKSACFSLFKGGSDPKVEQAARRLKSYVQNDQYKSKRANKRNSYGRH